MFRKLKWLIAACTVSLLAACGSDNQGPSNLVDVAKSDARFSILVEAVTAADLGTTLSGPGPFTVFAPTNDAFAALLTELGLTKEQLLANKPLLTTVLTYHVVAANVPKASVPLGKPITSVQGGIFKVDSVGPDLVVTDGRNRTAKIVVADVTASNGVIHAIDRVILPANRNIIETASALPQFSILVEAIGAANLGTALNGAGPFTVFAPTNDAFVALLGELGVTKEALLANTPLLTKVLTYHVLPTRALKAEVPVGSPIPTLQGQTVTVSATGGLELNDQTGRSANIVATDVFATNGVIHVIDKVVLPR